MTDHRSVDVLLAGWARSVRLDPADAERMRRSIVARSGQPAGLPHQWWRTFAFQVADVVVQANRRPVRAHTGRAA